MAEDFEKLADGLPDKHKADFFRILQEIGISKNDTELAKILCALQLYKAYYESIPASVMKTVSEVKQVQTEIEELASQAAQSAEAGEKSLNHLRQEAAQVNESLKKLHSHVEEAANKASAIVSKRMTELLTEAMKNALPLSDLAEAGKIFSETVKSGKKASIVLRKNARIVRWVHCLNYLIVAIVMIGGFWVYIHSRYQVQLEKEVVAVISQFEGNSDILLELAKSNRKLELSASNGNPKHKLLSVKNATGWTSKDKRGVIEIKD